MMQWLIFQYGLQNPHEVPSWAVLLQCIAMAHNSCQPHHHLWLHSTSSGPLSTLNAPLLAVHMISTQSAGNLLLNTPSVAKQPSLPVFSEWHFKIFRNATSPRFRRTSAFSSCCMYICELSPRNLFGDPSMFPCGDYSSNLKNLQSRCPAPYSKCPTFQSAQRKHASL